MVGVSKILTYTILKKDVCIYLDQRDTAFLRIHGYLHTSNNATIRLLMAAAAFAWHSWSGEKTTSREPSTWDMLPIADNSFK